MQHDQYMQLFAGTTGVILGVIVLLWAVLTFFLPFMVYSIMKSTKEILGINKNILAELQGKSATTRSVRVEPEV